MQLIDQIVKIYLMICLLIPPVAVFAVKPNAPARVRSARLLIPILLFLLTVSYTSDYLDCLKYGLECFLFDGLMLLWATFWYIMYLGWFEYVWRRLHKQIA
jgi:hypothetical protein